MNYLRIAFWNANGIHNKTAELKHFIEEHRIDVMLLGETHLKQSKKLKISNYITYRNDRPTRNGGGTAILMKHTIDHEALPQA